MPDATAAALATVPLLANLSLDQLTALAGRFETEEHAAGHVVVREGDAGYAFYVVGSGRLAVTVAGERLRTLEPGDFFGEISLLGDGRRTATVTAEEASELWVLFGTSFRVLQQERPDIAAIVEETSAGRMHAG